MAYVQVKIAQSTNQLERVVEFFRGGLGFKVLGRFQEHDGYDRLFLDLPD